MPLSIDTVRNDMSDNTPNTDPGTFPEQPQPASDAPVTPPAAPEQPAPGAPYVAPIADAPAAPEYPAAPAAPGYPGAPAAADYPGAPAAPGQPGAAGAPQYPGAPGYPGAPAAPGYPGAPAFGAGPGYGGAPAYGAGPVKPKGLALTAMILGIASLVLFWVPFLSPLLGLVAVVLGIMALVKKHHFAFGLTGLITGALGLIIGGFITMGVIIAFSLGGDVIQQGMSAAEACQAGAETVEIMGETVYCDSLYNN